MTNIAFYFINAIFCAEKLIFMTKKSFFFLYHHSLASYTMHDEIHPMLLFDGGDSPQIANRWQPRVVSTLPKDLLAFHYNIALKDIKEHRFQ